MALQAGACDGVEEVEELDVAGKIQVCGRFEKDLYRSWKFSGRISGEILVAQSYVHRVFFDGEAAVSCCAALILRVLSLWCLAVVAVAFCVRKALFAVHG